MKVLSRFLLLFLLTASVTCMPVRALADEADDYYERALAYFNEGDLNAAIIELKNTLQLSNRHLPARMLLGLALLESGEPAVAESQMELALELGADPNLVMPLMGTAWLVMGEHKKIFAYRNYTTFQPEHAAKWRNVRGKAYLQLSEFEKASKEFDLSMQLDPANAEALGGLSYAMLFQQRLDEADRIADQALGVDPDSDMVLTLKGDIAKAKGDVEASLAFYSRAIEENINNLSARQKRATLLVQTNRLEEAEKDLGVILAANPNSSRALVAQAILLARQQKNSEARMLLEEFNLRMTNVTDPEITSDVNYQIVRGLTLFMQGSYRQAMPFLEDVNRTNPEKVYVRQLLTSVYSLLGNHEKLVAIYRNVENLARSDSQYVYSYARAAWETGKYREAEEHFRTWMKRQPEFFNELSHLLAITLTLQGRNDAALEVLNALESGGAVSSSSLLLLGRIQLEHGQEEQAAATVARMQENYPDDARTLNFVCLYHKHRGEFEQALDYCRRAVKADPQNPGPVVNLSLIQMELKNYPAAVTGFEAVLKVFPEDTAATAGLAQAAAEQEQWEQAVRYAERLAIYDPTNAAYQLQLAGYYLRLGQTDRALEAVNQAERLKPLSPESFSLRAVAYRQQGEYEAAADQLRFLYGLYVDSNPDALADIAYEQLQLNRLEDAQRTIDRLRETPGHETPVAELQAELHLIAERPADCVAVLEQAREAAQSESARLLLAKCYTANGQAREALAVYDRMLAKRPIEAVAVRRFRLRVLSDNPAAVKELKAYVQRNPDSPWAIKALADNYTGTDLAEARKYYALLQEGWPELAAADVNNNLATILLLTGEDSEQALAYAERAYELDPESAVIADTYGWALVNRKQYAEGLRYLREAFARDSNNPEVQFHLAITLARQGRHEEARKFSQGLDRSRLRPEEVRQLEEIDKASPG